MDDIPGAIEWLDADTTGTLVKSESTSNNQRAYTKLLMLRLRIHN